MDQSRRDFLRLKPRTVAASPKQTRRQQQVDPVVHLLNRISWGPRPEEVERATEMGYEATLEEQLDPAAIDDSAAEAELSQFSLLALNRYQINSLANSEWRSQQQLTYGMIMRGVLSKRQLFERVVEFWTDHFNIPSEEYGVDLVQFHNQAIRAHALGKFSNLVAATAKEPAMLHYLDNYVNVAGNPNENYARELMELHTMGVDGGYTENDVKEVARAFTGWTVHNSTRTGFYFDPETHDTDPKEVLGHTLPAERGIEDGYHVLSILSDHPSTANFICRKLCVRFVSDNPPQSLVDSAAAVWRSTGGQITDVLRHIFLSAEFSEAVGAKLRRPLDFLIGALRATGTRPYNYEMLEEIAQDLGQPPYGWSPPNGYPDVAGAWLSSGGLLARWNVAMLLTHSAFSAAHMPEWESDDAGQGLYTDFPVRLGDPQTVGELVDAISQQVFGEVFTGGARQEFVKYVVDNSVVDTSAEETPLTYRIRAQKLGSLFGLMLASNEYQWR